MRKYIFIFVLSLFRVLCSYAEGDNVNYVKTGFESNIKLKFDYGLPKYKTNSCGVEYIAGYRFNPIIKAGIGTGMFWTDQVYKEYVENMGEGINGATEINHRENAALVPIFINFKVNFTKKRISPFFSINVGQSLYVSSSELSKINHLKVFINYSFGVDFHLNNGAITAEIGRKFQNRKIDSFEKYRYGNIWYDQIGLYVGYQF